MALELGNYTLRGVEFTFAFDGERLNLFPKDENERTKAMALTHLKTGKGAYAFPGNPIECPKEPQVLLSQSSGKRLIVFPISVNYYPLNLRINSLGLDIGNWALLATNEDVSGISITSPILDHSFDIQGAIDSSFLDQDGEIEICSSQKPGRAFRFTYKETVIEGYLSHQRRVSFRQGTSPLTLASRLSLTFEPTNSFSFVQELVFILHNYLAFLVQGSCFGFNEAAEEPAW